MWIITKDKIDDGKYEGYRSGDFHDATWEQKHPLDVYRFRLKDDDGEIYFYGKFDTLYEDETQAFEPLDNFGKAFGCTILEYWDIDEKKWEVL